MPVPSTAVSEELKTEYRCRFHYSSVYYCTQNKYLSQYVRYAGQFQVFLQYRCFMLNIGFIFFSWNHKIQYSVFNYVWNVQNALKLQKKKKTQPTTTTKKNNLLERCKELGNSCLKSTSRLSTSITWDYNKDSGKFWLQEGILLIVESVLYNFFNAHSEAVMLSAITDGSCVAQNFPWASQERKHSSKHH